ncbi:MAG: ABC transporter ATP-binding protein [Acidobacteriota bacterium]
MAVAEIDLDRVSKHWGGTRAVDDVSFKVPPNRFVVLLGPSGCGKSTTLRLIAGLEEVTSGRIFIHQTEVTALPPSSRRLSMVFQSYALFPHLSVAENIVFGLKVRRVDPAARRERLSRVAALVGLSDLLQRKPAQLSGGQRQRVALARAIIAEHPICLMDEPLSNLDARLRHDMRIEIHSLQRRLGMTVVYVTHDQVEAMSMADQIILMRDGRIEQEGAPEELYSRPVSTFAAGFIGTPPMNLLDLVDGAAGAAIAGGEDTAVVRGGGAGLKLGVRPEDIRLSDTAGVPARLINAEYLGADTIVTARIGEQSLLVRVAGRVRVDTEQAVHLGWRSRDAHVFETRSGNRVEGREAITTEQD